MSIRFTCDGSGEPEDLPHFWEHCVGSGRAALALRADWQAQLKRCREELGFRHVRFHGLLDADMGTLVEVKDELLYSFQNADRIFDFLRSIGMRPSVELSFMPPALSSGDQTVFHYKANVTPPADYGRWASLVSRLAQHWLDRYGAKEVCLWPIEVWNEPNLENFWTGSREDYFRLFETTWKALKHVHPDLQVGGPVTANNGWIPEFLEFCKTAQVPPDFISTHTYPTDAMGSPEDDTKTMLSKSRLDILRERAAEVREQIGERPLHYTEWSISSNPRDPLHDDPFAAAYVVRTLLNMGSLVQSYSYWTFSDIFEENYFPAEPFHGGFGLMTLPGVPKPVYRAYEILHGLGEQRLEVKGSHGTVSVWAVRKEDSITVVIVNLALPDHPIETESVQIELSGLPGVEGARVRRIDADHANAKAKWKLQGEPCYPSPKEVAELMEASELRSEDLEVRALGGKHRFEITMQPQSVVAAELRLARAARSSGKSQVRIPAPHAFDAEDEKLLDGLQSCAFRYFLEYTDPSNGLVADSTKPGAAASIAATGFALSCYPVAVERDWLSRQQAAEVALKTLEFFAESRQGGDAQATGYKGFYYHFLDRSSGRCARDCELSTIDTTLLLAGVVTAAQYFDGATKAERKIRTLAERLFERVDWPWTLDDHMRVNHAWKPGEGFKEDGWDHYSEAMILYVLGAASVLHPLPREVYDRVARNYLWQRTAGKDWITAGPLFIHLFPQAWLDLRGLDDGYVGKKGDYDYFLNTQHAIFVQRVHAFLNPWGFTGYGKDVWGLSACAGPEGKRRMRDGREHEFLGYAARGVPAGPDDGTLVPWAAAACLAHEPEAALASLRTILESYPQSLRDGRFVDAINPSLPGDSVSGWIAPACTGIDQGLVVMMIENARTGLIWELTRNSPVFRRGLRNLGFHGGWLDGT